MGAWGLGNFENDDAFDWFLELERQPAQAVIESALNEMLTGEYLDAPFCSAAVAAIDVLTRLKGHPINTDQTTKQFDEWVAKNPQDIPDALVEKAKKALVAITNPENSELYQLWAEGSEKDAWLKIMASLETALNA